MNAPSPMPGYLHSLLAHLPLPTYLKNSHCEYEWSNYAWQELVDLDNGDLIGKTDEDLFSGVDGVDLLLKDRECLAENTPVRNDISFKKNGMKHAVQIYRVSLQDAAGSKAGLFGIVVDATAQQALSVHIESMIDELTVQRRALHSHAIVSYCRRDGHYLYASDPYCAITGYKREDLYTTNRFAIGMVPRGMRNPEQLEEALSGNSGQIEIRTLSKTGQPIWLHSIIVPVPNPGSADFTYFEIANDVSAIKLKEELLSSEINRQTVELRRANRKLEADVQQRKVVEEKLSSQNALVQTILASLPQEVLVLNDAGILKHCNRAWQQFQEDFSLPGTLHSARKGDNFFELCKEIDNSCAEEVLESMQAVRSGIVPDVEVTYRESSRAGDRWYSLRINIWKASAQGLLVTFHDVTESRANLAELARKNEELHTLNEQLGSMQTQLLQTEKMASIGQLAAGVAHEINNPIGFINSNVSTLESYSADLLSLIESYEAIIEKNPDGAEQVKTMREQIDFNYICDDLSTLLQETRDGVGRVKRIIQDLKDFSRLDSGADFENVDIHTGLNSTLNIVNNEIKYKCTVSKEYADLPLVECNLSQLNQVFLNLLVNASHAIEAQGSIKISTGRVGEEVFVKVEDSGKGIAPEHLQRVFDPFFTTKPVGQGTGLGLYLSYGIIQKHHGKFEVSSQQGVGTTFTIWLPIQQPKASATE